MTITPELLHAAREGERKAQYQLYQQCYPVLMSVCVRYRRDESEAVAALNDGFLKILQNLHRYSPDIPFIAWIRRIQINTLIDMFRREAKWRDQVLLSEKIEQTSDKVSVDWNEADQRFDAQQLEALLQRLPPVSRQVFNLFALDGYSHAEISAMLDISEGTSKWHVSFARSQLRGWIRAGLEQEENTSVR
ncbi:MAG: sigma-70 family RNA polymerase sigma factor [Bacteroidetes bacterium]|nr:MAG: sigma-70 family RNA polymerase sigma factor [Bacteroidota bacterium]